MTKGTTSFGTRRVKTHTICIRCGRRAFHNQKKRCGACGYPSPSMRHYNWALKEHRRHTVGTGRCRHLREIQRRFRSGFKQGEQPRKVYTPKKDEKKEQ